MIILCCVVLILLVMIWERSSIGGVSWQQSAAPARSNVKLPKPLPLFDNNFLFPMNAMRLQVKNALQSHHDDSLA